MSFRLPEIILWHPYPVAAGKEFGYTLFDGKEWHRCDEKGRILWR